MKKVLILISLIVFALFSSTYAMECVIPKDKPIHEVENFSNQDVKTIFMGKVISRTIKRQGGGYKFYKITFNVKARDMKKGQYPEDGMIDVYAPVSDDLCGYHDKNYFSVGSYIAVFAKENNNLNLTDKFLLNRKFNDEIEARDFLNSVVSIVKKNTVVNIVKTEESIFERFLNYILYFGLGFLVLFYILARKFGWGKFGNKDDDFYEDDEMMHFTTENDEIEIRVRKDKLNQ